LMLTRTAALIVRKPSPSLSWWQIFALLMRTTTTDCAPAN